jgi:hypothetical protein
VKLLNIFLLLILLSGVVYSQSGYFYTGKNYGSEATFNPVSLIINGGFDIFQVQRNRDIRSVAFSAGLNNVIRNIKDPITPINHYGWWNFIKDQVIPFSIDKNDAQYWPNYTLHLIGGGRTYAAMTEWYKYHNFPNPSLLSILTMASYHIVNETVENEGYQGDNVDPIADIYLFDVGGIVLFSFDGIKKFFAEEMNLADWSLQPSFALRNSELHNVGQYFSIKWKFPFFEKWYLFYYFGTNGMGGVSYKYNDGTALSVGVGFSATDLVIVDPKTNKKSLNLDFNLGVFYDKNNSLLASLVYTKKSDYRFNLNVYPGVFKIGTFSPGFFSAYNPVGKIIWGISAAWLPFGVAHFSYR